MMNRSSILRVLILGLGLLMASQGWSRDWPHVTNTFSDTDIRAVLKELSESTSISIIADTSVHQQEISIDFKDEPLDVCLNKLGLLIGFVWKPKSDFVIISMAYQDSPMFSEFAVTKSYIPKTESAASLVALLSKAFQPYVQTDKIANMVTITATQPQVDAIMEALEIIDKRRRQFIVEALVTEINVDDSKSAGLTWNWRNFAQSLDSGLVYSEASSADIVTLKALIDKKKANLKANPRITATEGKEASIFVGSETYYPMVGGTAYAPTIQFQKVNTGIHLLVTGYIGDDGLLNLHLQPEVSDAAAPVGGSPTTTIRKADTYMTVKSGTAIVLGGLTREYETNEVQKVPILGDLPFIGNFFRSSDKAKHKSEVVIVIIPHLIDESVTTIQAPEHVLQKPADKPKTQGLKVSSASMPPTPALMDEGLKKVKP